jgi:hypothetical protein
MFAAKGVSEEGDKLHDQFTTAVSEVEDIEDYLKGVDKLEKAINEAITALSKVI